ncbi:PREDICTED: transport and Golgi organization protein 2 homolog [Fragaria vesca subsp. vesca]|uniref:transport and Golgi organization protein 2 homolog n=1 Tax=Fragaria vesca subsp. vesca TaxID=101020 RepID=UPI0002C2DCC1|nr:PREDICTED: transport and Golgi organization protein 2 homolog [Fragaria vesca subsp. vesca]XP_011458095.1 PREDICTED: transport and Golgi organization protein 2 homolog [Fragaria vesca subsp. vesca]
MCIAAFVWQCHPRYPFLLLLNRDEYFNRGTAPLAWWDDNNRILGGRDAVEGGTWMACSKDGKVALLTNVRELKRLEKCKSRGHLPSRFLSGKKSPMEFAEEVVEEADQYNGFNLILADLRSKTMLYVTNRPKEEKKFVTEVSPGIHVLTNDAMLDSPWPKSQRLGNSFKEVLNKYGDDEVSLKEMAVQLMTDTTRDDRSLLPCIYSPEVEYELSSIFIAYARELGCYGTRSTDAVSVNTTGEVTFYERYIAGDWYERTETFLMNETENE